MHLQEHHPLVARFMLHVRCHNCRALSVKNLDVPDVEDAPRDTDELLTSELLMRQSFHCAKCDGRVGTLSGIKQIEHAF